MNFINSKDFTKEEYFELFEKAKEYATNGIPSDLLKNKVVTTLFLQPSTRTMSALQSGAIRAGGGWIGATDEHVLSLSKGETLEDTIKTYSSFSDIIALRHPDDDAAERAAKSSDVPILNCGSGSKNHTVGALMILFNVFHYMGDLKGKTIGIYGTPGINRICNEMIPILGHFGVKLLVDDLGHFPVSEEVVNHSKENGLQSIEYGKIDEIITKADVVIVTRGLQKGIFKEGEFSKEKEEMILSRFKPIDKELMSKMPSTSFLEMIPPRIFEISTDVDSDPRSIYSKKIMYTEIIMAIITKLLKLG